MKKKQLLLGDEAIALGAINAGIAGVYAYPGTPSTEITEYVQNSPQGRGGDIFCRWCTNEKTALEAALGVSYVGRRSIVCMKHVGLNVAADPFMNGAMTGTNGGLIVVVADDPSMHSSQGEQDSRFYGKFALVPTLEPSSQQEAYDMIDYGFRLSEDRGEPVLMRITTRMAHSRAVVEYDDAVAGKKPLSFPKDPSSWILLPVNARRRYPQLIETYNALERESDSSPYNNYFDGDDHSMGIIASGIAYNYLRENVGDSCRYPILKISQYPMPKKLICRLAAECSRILVMEEGQPFIEEQVAGILPRTAEPEGLCEEVLYGVGRLLSDLGSSALHSCKVEGRLSGALPRVGELTPDCVRAALSMEPHDVKAPAENVVPRPPALCRGCGHRDLYNALNEVMEQYSNSRVFSDIGCYTLGALPPFKSICSCVDMGAAITMTKGAADAGYFPAVGVIGDSTFAHSGITGLLDVANCKSNVLIIISDNETTGMTGGQDSAGTGKIEKICEAVGIDPEHINVVVPLPGNMEQIKRLIKSEIEYDGPSVLISRRECIQTAKRHAAAARARK